MEETTTAALTSRIDDLIALCATLARENQALQKEQAAWRAERTRLIERNELAKSKIDAMIGRLRSLDEPEAGGQTNMAGGGALSRGAPPPRSGGQGPSPSHGDALSRGAPPPRSGGQGPSPSHGDAATEHDPSEQAR